MSNNIEVKKKKKKENTGEKDKKGIPGTCHEKAQRSSVGATPYHLPGIRQLRFSKSDYYLGTVTLVTTTTVQNW